MKNNPYNIPINFDNEEYIYNSIFIFRMHKYKSYTRYIGTISFGITIKILN
jgi:hypothetical protein